MIKDLPNLEYKGIPLSTENSYQYGPICIDTAYRSTEVLPNVFKYSALQMKERFKVLVTFINHINPRSYNAHVRKLGLDVIQDFEFNNNQYYELALDLTNYGEKL